MNSGYSKWGQGIGAGLLMIGGLASGGAQAADPGQGQQLYERHCEQCHGAAGVPDMPGVPDFSRGERLMQSDRQLMQTIRQGRGVMPAFAGLLTDHEILDVIAYLRTLR